MHWTRSGVVFWHRIDSVMPAARVPQALVTALSTAISRVPEEAVRQTDSPLKFRQTSHSTVGIRNYL